MRDAIILFGDRDRGHYQVQHLTPGQKKRGEERFAGFVLHNWNNGALLGLNRVLEEEEEVLNTSYTYIYVRRELGLYSYALMFQAK